MKTDKKTEEFIDEVIIDQKRLILWNDNVNTFDHVIDCLVAICDHTKTQAEQCAYLVHYKGKCNIKSGSKEKLEPLLILLANENLTVEIK